MIGLQLAVKSILRQPRRHLIAVLGIISVLTPLMLMWGMKVGLVSRLMTELRSAPSNLEVRLKGDYLLDETKLVEIKALDGLGFAIPTARILATRAFASLEDGARRTPVSLLPTAPGDPLLKEAARDVGPATAVISRSLADRLGVTSGGFIEISSVRRERSENLRVGLRVQGIVAAEGIGGQWVFVDPALVQSVEAFIDGYAVPQYNVPGKPSDERRTVHSGMRIYANSIEEVSRLVAGLEDLGFVVESNAARIESVLRLNRILNAVVVAIGAILLLGLSVSIWAGLAAILEQLRRHVALLGLMGARSFDVSLYFITVGAFIAVASTAVTILGTYGLGSLGNRWFVGLTGEAAPAFSLPLGDLGGLTCVVLLLQAVITFVIAGRATRIQPQEIMRDD